MPTAARLALGALALSALALGAAACAPSVPELRRADLVGTVWRELCPDPAIAPAVVELRPDGLVGWSYAEPEALARDGFRLDTVHTWAVDGGALWVRWNVGTARSRYRPSPEADRLVADTSTFCLPGPELRRLRYPAASVRSSSTPRSGITPVSR